MKLTNGKIAILVIFLVLFIDQFTKIWVKTHMYLGEDIEITKWFYILFIENNGMAFGIEIISKLFLSLFRIAAVIFIGYYQLSNNIKDKNAVKKDSAAGRIINYTSKKAKKSYTYTTCQTSISSYISWSIYSFSSANVELKKFFNSCGYDFKLGTNEQFEEATKKYINIPSYNDSGYILDAGDYIVVKVGNYSPNFYDFLYE